MSNKSNDLKTVTAKFLGKELATEAQTYKKYKAKFEVGGQARTFSYFMPWTKKDGTEKGGVNPKELEEGEFYSIKYSEFQNAEMTFPAKTAVLFFKAKEGDKSAKPSANNVAKPWGVDDETLKMMKQNYDELVPEGERNLNHFVGTVVLSVFPTETQNMVDLFGEKEGQE